MTTSDPALGALRAQHRAVVRWLRPLAPLILAVVAISAFTAHPAPTAHGRGLAVAFTLAVVLVTGLGAVLTAGHPGPAHAVLVVGLLAASAALAWVQPDGFGIAGVFVGLSLLAPLFRGHRSVPLIIVAVVLFALAIATAQHASVIAALLTAILIAAFYGMLLLAIRLADANRRTEQLLAELAASRDAQAEAAQLAERQRLAREMHDVLAHSLSGLLLQLEGARMLAAENPADPRLPAALERAHQLGRGGLEEARRAIGTLRDDELPGPERLGELARQFERDRGVPCAVVTTGEPRPLGSEARLALYRVAQEALTNVAKHADRPARVVLALAYEPDAARLTVEDFRGDPLTASRPDSSREPQSHREADSAPDADCGPTNDCGPDADCGPNTKLKPKPNPEAGTNSKPGANPGLGTNSKPGTGSAIDPTAGSGVHGGSESSTRSRPGATGLDHGGYGLTGMRERAELLGGRLTAAPTGHGFRVELQVPA